MSLYISPPETINIDGKEYLIDTDFRTWIKFQNIILKNTDNDTKTADLMDFMEKMGLPFLETTISAILDFFTGGNTTKKSDNKKTPSYDFEEDSQFIYTAYLSQYHIDLSVEKLHWWKFKAMFASLSEEHTISKIMWARNCDMENLSDDMKEYVRSIRKSYPINVIGYMNKQKTAEEHHKELIQDVKDRYVKSIEAESNLS